MNDERSLASMIFALDQGNAVRVLTIGALFGATIALLQNIGVVGVLCASAGGALFWGAVWRLTRTRRSAGCRGQRLPDMD